MLRRLFHLTAFLALALTASAASHETDVCIYGGTSAGAIGAVQVAKMDSAQLRERLVKDGQILTAPVPSPHPQ